MRCLRSHRTAARKQQRPARPHASSSLLPPRTATPAAADMQGAYVGSNAVFNAKSRDSGLSVGTKSRDSGVSVGTIDSITEIWHPGWYQRGHSHRTSIRRWHEPHVSSASRNRQFMSPARPNTTLNGVSTRAPSMTSYRSKSRLPNGAMAGAACRCQEHSGSAQTHSRSRQPCSYETDNM